MEKEQDVVEIDRELVDWYLEQIRLGRYVKECVWKSRINYGEVTPSRETKFLGHWHS